MKAKIKATATLRAGTGDLTYFGQFHRGEEVDIIANCNADSVDIYNTTAGNCFLCRRSNGTMSYALATDLEIIEYSPSIDWEQRRYELTLAIYPDVLKHNSEIAMRTNGFIPASQAVRSTMECVDVMIERLKGGQE